MPRYYVNNFAQPNGDHEVHKSDCYWSSLAVSKKDLGIHVSCDSSVIEAKKTYLTANGCNTCSNECNTG
ncbi:MAG: hypothetical protein CVU01_01960 [Bacteroidetes bacterium HGW-Bacteroidetes-18]|nr:MAG: hypothetical protein CVU01_01960 [Bacteroidetes bacterium HGW-Bacteroidetes-18]